MKNSSFIIYKNGKFYVSWRKTTSLLANYLLMKEIILSSRYVQGRVLDVGCGSKPYQLIFQNKVKTYVGIDLDGNPDFFASALYLPFKSQTFDTVLCTEVLEHVPEPSIVIKEIERVLKNKGILILSCPQIYPVHNSPNDFYRFTKFGLREIVKKNGKFKIVDCYPIGRTMDVAVDFSSKILSSILNRRYIPKILRYFIVGFPQRMYILFRKKGNIGSEKFALNNFLIAQKCNNREHQT